MVTKGILLAVMACLHCCYGKALIEDIEIGSGIPDSGGVDTEFDDVFFETRNSDDVTQSNEDSTRYNAGRNPEGVNLHGIEESDDDDSKPVRDVIDLFLSRVELYESSKENCTPGTGESLGDGVITQFGLNKFKNQALVAVNRANFLTHIWRGVHNKSLISEYFLYSQVMNLLESDDAIFAAGNCYDEYEYKNYKLFCPYAHRMGNNSEEIMVKDLSVVYPEGYLTNMSEFFYKPRQNAEDKLTGEYNQSLSLGRMLFRLNDTTHHEEVVDESMQSTYEDGHWSKPYFDCGGGDIWMMTYTVPFFGYNSTMEKYYFKGTSGIDIDLREVDINQCPNKSGDPLNVFANTDKCKHPSTRCVPVQGLGFRRGSYKCECADKYYFPENREPRYFNGSEIEQEHEKKLQGDSHHRYDTYFECIPCAEGCDSCLDASPCVLTLNWLQRNIVLGTSCFIMCFIPVLFWFTILHRNVKVLKAASPMLLRVILFGALLLYSPMIVNYFEPTNFTCSLRIWLREIGFSISYGALLLKTWRISVVFRVRSAQRIKISDTDLMKRLLLVVMCFAAYLTVRMLVGRPQVIQGEHSNGLRTHQCSWDTWDYCAGIAEILLLLWGIRLCIVVRKAPSEFNESRFISWAIYNETLLSLFLNITMVFLKQPANPDLLYLVLFIHTQLTTTVTLAFLFCSKAYLVYKYRDKEQPTTTMRGGSKYTAAPTSKSTCLNSSSPNSCAERLCDNDLLILDSSRTLEKDIQDEFKRLYMQLEMLKQKNMKLGNPHLGYKLSAMTEAAMKEEPPESPPASPDMNGKRVVINLDTFKDGTCL